MKKDQSREQFSFIPILVVIIVVLVSAIWYYGQTGSNQPPQAKATNVNVNLDNDPYIGNVQAPIKLVYFFDYQCPFCRRFEEEVLPLIEKNYVATGKMVIYFRGNQFLGPDSITAGVAGQCLAKQIQNKKLSYDIFAQWQAAMMKAQGVENSGWASAANIEKLTTSLNLNGIDSNQFNQCLDQRSTVNIVNEEAKANQAIGVDGTPSFLINGNLYVGALPYGQFVQIFDRILGQK